MFRISDGVNVYKAELKYQSHTASGPGGQNVNKVETAVQLRFDVPGSRGLPTDVRTRLTRLAGRRINSEGVLIINAQRYRSQDRNREDATMRLIALIGRASKEPLKRRHTKPTIAAKERRLATKTHRGKVKRNRGSVQVAED